MYSFESRVRYSEADETGRLSLLALMDYLQDCSTFQSETLGVGIDHLRNAHIGWFVANWEIEIHDLPRFYDRIVISTWSYDITKTYGFRNFTIENPEGYVYVRADSLWFVFDTIHNRPMKIPSEEAAPYNAQAGSRLAMPPLERKIAVKGTGYPTRPTTVSEQHLDTNHHVNNARYVQIAAEALDERFQIATLQVQYRTAAVLGDTITPVVYDTGEGHIVDLTDGAGSSFATVKMTGNRG